MVVVGQFVVGYISVARQGFLHGADGSVMFHIQRFVFSLVVLFPVFPCAHEGVLEDGQLVGVVPDVVEELLHQARGDLATAHLGRAFDGEGALAAVQAWDEVFALVDRFGEAFELMVRIT